MMTTEAAQTRLSCDVAICNNHLHLTLKTWPDWHIYPCDFSHAHCGRLAASQIAPVFVSVFQRCWTRCAFTGPEMCRRGSWVIAARETFAFCCWMCDSEASWEGHMQTHTDAINHRMQPKQSDWLMHTNALFQCRDLRLKFMYSGVKTLSSVILVYFIYYYNLYSYFELAFV